MWNYSFNCGIYQLDSHTYIYSAPVPSVGGDSGQLGPVPAPDQHGADLPAAAAGDGHAEAGGDLWAAGGAAAKMWGWTEKGEVTGSRPGGLHW